VGLSGCAEQYFIISSLACSGTLIATASTNSKTQLGAMVDGCKFYDESGAVIETQEHAGEFKEW
jgi:hypothetical protein